MIQIATFKFNNKRIIMGLDEQTKKVISSEGHLYDFDCKSARRAFEYIENHFEEQDNFSWLADYDTGWNIIQFPKPMIERILEQ